MNSPKGTLKAWGPEFGERTGLPPGHAGDGPGAGPLTFPELFALDLVAFSSKIRY